MSSVVRIPMHTLIRAHRARANADARLAAAAAARANYIATLKDRAARTGAHVVEVVARERLRRAEEAARRAATLANKLATAEARRNAHMMRARRNRARRAQARRSRVRSVRERREASYRRSNTRDWRNSPTSQKQHSSSSFEPTAQLRATVAFVQSTYLLRRARRALVAAGLKPCSIANIPFPKFSQLIASRPAQVGASRALRAVGTRATHGGVRTLLAALIIALHPETAGNQRPIISRARSVTSCLYFGTLDAFSNVWHSWPQHFNDWKKRDREMLVNALAADAVAVDNVIGTKSQWKPEMVAHLRRIENAARYIGGEKRLSVARASVQLRKDDALIHEMLIDLPAFLRQTAQPNVIPEQIWSAVERDLANNSVQESRALQEVLNNLAIALNGMVPNSFQSPQLDDELLALRILERACTALRASQAPAADEALAQWEREAYNRLENGNMYVILRELSELVLKTAANVRVIRMRDVAPVVTQHGHVWERARFEERIAAGEFEPTLPHTRAFMNPIDAPLRPEFLQCAVAKLVCGDMPLPEVLSLDFNRIAQLRITAHVAAHVAALVAALRGLEVTEPNVEKLRTAMLIHGTEAAISKALEQVNSSSRVLAERVLNRAVHGQPVEILLERIVGTCSTSEFTVAPSALTCVEEDVKTVFSGVKVLANHLALVHGERLAALRIS